MLEKVRAKLKTYLFFTGALKDVDQTKPRCVAMSNAEYTYGQEIDIVADDGSVVATLKWGKLRNKQFNVIGWIETTCKVVVKESRP